MKFNLGPDGSQLIYYKNQQAMEANNGVIFVGQTITIPKPGSVLPTTTPIPADIPSGRLIEYRVLPGDTLAGIAFKFNSIADNIIEENEIENANALQVGQILQIPVNLKDFRFFGLEFELNTAASLISASTKLSRRRRPQRLVKPARAG